VYYVGGKCVSFNPRPLYPRERALVPPEWAPLLVWTISKRDKSVRSAGNQPCLLEPAVLNLITISAELSRATSMFEKHLKMFFARCDE